MNNIQLFNSYYFNFLKKLKDIAKPLKGENEDAENIYKVVKSIYPSYEKNSEEYLNWFKENNKIKDLFTLDASYSDIVNKLDDEDIKGSLIYKEITLTNIRKVLKKDQIVLHFCAIFLIFSEDTTNENEDIINCINNVKSLDEFNKYINNIQSERIKILLKYIYTFNEQVSTDANLSIKELEDTSLGKLAKEIMSEINIDEIQSSLVNSDGTGKTDGGIPDILSSLSNPDSGITKLLSTVSQKMISKISSGEINQGDLLQDAMKFSSKLGSSGLMPGLGNMGNMLNMMQKMSANQGMNNDDSDEDIDMSSLKNIMQGMVENMGNKKGRGPGPVGRAETRIDNNKMNRIIKQKQLRKKLEKKRKEKAETEEN